MGILKSGHNSDDGHQFMRGTPGSESIHNSALRGRVIAGLGGGWQRPALEQASCEFTAGAVVLGRGPGWLSLPGCGVHVLLSPVPRDQKLPETSRTSPHVLLKELLFRPPCSITCPQRASEAGREEDLHSDICPDAQQLQGLGKCPPNEGWWGMRRQPPSLPEPRSPVLRRPFPGPLPGPVSGSPGCTVS